MKDKELRKLVGNMLGDILLHLDLPIDHKLWHIYKEIKELD